MDVISIQQELTKLHDQTDQITKSYSEAKTVFENLNHHSKTLLAQYSADYSGTQSAIANKALSDTRYVDHLEALKEARAAYNRAWSLLEGLRIKLSCLQSIGKHLTNI